MSDTYADNMHAGRAAATAGRWDEAEQCFRRALSALPGAIAALRGLGEALIFQKRFAEAVDLWRAIVALEPDHASSQEMLGLALMRRRDLGGAAAHLGRALALEPARAEAAFNLGRISVHTGDRVQAAAYFAHAVQAAPTHAKALAALVQTLSELNRDADAVAAAEKGLTALADAAPKAVNEVRHHLAHAYRRLGDLPRVAACYRAIVAADATDSVAQHLLAAAEGKVTEEHAGGFVKTFFDNLAETFDAHLVDRLGYTSPTRIAAHLGALRPEAGSFAAVLDLGCGTGLMGQALAASYRSPRLVGVDVSEKMLREAAKRAIYTELVAGDLAGVMGGRTDAFDLVVAADVLIYVGDLAPVFAQAARLLRAGGVFAFTVEISASADVELSLNGHYRHNVNYILRLASANGLKLLHAADEPIRKETTDMVLGHYIYLEKPSRP